MSLSMPLHLHLPPSNSEKKKYTLMLFKEFMALGHLGELGFSVLCPLLSVVSHQV